MRLFRLSNKNHIGGWVFATDEFEARAIFLEAKRVKKPENIKTVLDQTDFYANSTDLKDVKVAGEACLAISTGLNVPVRRSWCISRNGKVLRDLSKGIQ